MLGGEVIDSGGFGCVFYPQLNCNSDSNEDKNNHKNNHNNNKGISKIMKNIYAEEEFTEINYIKNILKKTMNEIDIYKYFVFHDITMCKPKKVSTTDLINFKKKCSALSKLNITNKNINTRLNDLSIINMPFAGIPLDDYWFNNFSNENIITINDKLIKLFVNAVCKINNNGIYHSDIKASNILVDVSHKKIYVRLIDWGLTAEYNSSIENNGIPNNWKNRSFQFNVPFEIILFSDDFNFMYRKFNNERKTYTENELYIFLNDFINYWINVKKKGGHIKVISSILKMIYGKSTNVEHFITIYLKNIIISFVNKNGYFDTLTYLKHVFIKNIDVWGMIISYMSLFEMLHNSLHTLNKNEMKLYLQIRSIFDVFIYLPNDTTLSINKVQLVKELKKISKILYNDSSKKYISNDRINTNYKSILSTVETEIIPSNHKYKSNSKSTKSNLIKINSIKSNSRKSNSRKSNSRKSNSRKSNSRKSNSRKSNSRKSNSRKSNSRKSNSRKSNSRKSNSRERNSDKQ